MLPILFESDDLIAINKPPGLLVHRTRIAADAKEFALQLLRDQIGQKVYPVHRLDRKTSGVLLFAKNPTTHTRAQQLFEHRQVQKSYLAIVRGFIDAAGTIAIPLKINDKFSPAETHYQRLQQFELPLSSGPFPTSRYSFVLVHPRTGRFHQIRRHLSHISHPIIGDRPHGCNKQNRFWKDQFGLTDMLLHAVSLSFGWDHNQQIHIEAPLSQPFGQVLGMLNLFRL